MKLWVVRFFLQGDHGSHFIGVFDSMEEAKKAKEEYGRPAWAPRTLSWTSIEIYELNKYYAEDEGGVWIEP